MARALTGPKARPDPPAVPRARLPRQPAVVPAFAAAPDSPPRPHGPVDSAGAADIAAVAERAWADWKTGSGSRRRGIFHLLGHLSAFAGDTWQQRWEASGLDDRGRPVRALATGADRQAEATQGVEALFCLRVIQPSLEAFRSNNFKDDPEAFRVAQGDEALDAFFTAVAAVDTARHWQRRALLTSAPRSLPKASPSPT